MTMVDIPKTRAEQIALRDRLNALIDHPGADPSPIAAEASDPHRSVFAENRRRATLMPGIGVVIEAPDIEKTLGITLSESGARRLGHRLIFLADNPGAG